MSFDAAELRRAVAAHGPVARVVVAAVQGSAPREPGASLLVWSDGQSGTIGGGALELEATAAARMALASGSRPTVAQRPLGPALGQCCGGSVTLVTEVFDAAGLDRLAASASEGHLLRPITADPTAPLPFAMKRRLADLRNGSGAPGTLFLAGWLLEPLAAPCHALWVHGAGHVGRALLGLMAPLPDWQVTWVDTAPERFPAIIPDGVERLVAAQPALAVSHAPRDAHHLILTYSHALDLDLCHALLLRGFASAGLIGSATKWARFRKRLRALGHSDGAIARITCPIGSPALGKHPQAIAIGTVASLLETARTAGGTATMERQA